ncbi:hypothetical protein M885DRAFT_616038 [Pelagophyceae sp. CCMP2097]|nr:hypothetical protein M885DRAFT_616038 [Pelagophyceae sp. CCMP2097]
MALLRVPLRLLAAACCCGISARAHSKSDWLGYHENGTGLLRCSHVPTLRYAHPQPAKAECLSWDCNWRDGGCFRRKNWLKAKFLGVGWKKTGTTSLAAAYEALHLTPHCECDDLTKFKASQDSPLSLDVGRIAKAKLNFPEARFILTVRPAASWNASVVHWTTVVKPQNFKIYSRKMGGHTVGTADFVAAYERHNEAVRGLFRDSPERLLELNLEVEDSVAAMRRLCDFVDKTLRARHADVCDSSFPHQREETHNGDGGYANKAKARRRIARNWSTDSWG